jgi:hypothetical protein
MAQGKRRLTRALAFLGGDSSDTDEAVTVELSEMAAISEATFSEPVFTPPAVTYQEHRAKSCTDLSTCISNLPPAAEGTEKGSLTPSSAIDRLLLVVDDDGDQGHAPLSPSKI